MQHEWYFIIHLLNYIYLLKQPNKRQCTVVGGGSVYLQYGRKLLLVNIYSADFVVHIGADNWCHVILIITSRS